MTANPLKPSPALLSKLGSIMVHASEFLSPDGHFADRTALLQLIADPEVETWRAQMDEIALLPRKRVQP